MRKLQASMVSSALLVVFSSIAFGSGIFCTPGTKANAMGGAFVAVADDATAVYWNPAGLTQLDARGVEASVIYMPGETKSNTSLKNVSPLVRAIDSLDGDFPFPNVYGTEPGEYSSKVCKVTALIPAIGTYIRSHGITYAAGYFGVAGGVGAWESTIAGVIPQDSIHAKIDAQQGFAAGNISAAANVNSDLSVGVGINWVTMTDKATVIKDYTSAGLAPTVNYNFLLDKSAQGSAPELVLGGLYRLSQKMKIGATFRSGTEITLKGSAHYVQRGLSVLAPGNPLYADIDASSDYTQKYVYPLTYEIGMAYDPADKITLAASLSGHNYSVEKDKVTYDMAGFPLANSDKSSDWKDVIVWHLGGQYRVNNKMSVLVGLQNDPEMYTSNKLTLVDTNQYDMTKVSLGMDYQVGTVKLTGNLYQSFSKTSSKDGRTYEFPYTSFMLSVGYAY